MYSKILSDDALANPAFGRDKVRMWERSAAFPLVALRTVTARGLHSYGQRTLLAPWATHSSTGKLSALQLTALALEQGPQVRLRRRSSCQSGVWKRPAASLTYPNYLNRVGSKPTVDILLGNFTICVSLGHEHIASGTYDVPVNARLWNSGSAWYARVGSDGSETVYITAACWS